MDNARAGKRAKGALWGAGPVAALVLLLPLPASAAIVYGTLPDYTAAAGSEVLNINFDGSTGLLVDGTMFSPAVTFSSPEAVDTTKVHWNSDELSDAPAAVPNCVLMTTVGPLGGVFTAPVTGFAMDILSNAVPITVDLFDAGDALIASLPAAAVHFFGVTSITPIKRFVLHPGLFGNGCRDRIFIDNFRANGCAPGPCNDGNACTTGDTCVAGVCVGGPPPTCNDGNACTSDSCNPLTGCVFANNSNPCSDGSSCTTGDTCSGGACVGTPVVCSDGSVCTTDSCNPVSGCVFTPVVVGACGDGICQATESPCGCPADCPDTDGDGLANSWETGGVDCNGDAVIDLNLPALGANPLVKDVFVEVDYMVLGGPGGHSHQPDPAAVAQAVTAYATAGITLHVDATEALPHSNVVTFAVSPDPANCEGPDYVAFDSLKASHFNPARRPAFHYAVWGHLHTCDSAAHCSGPTSSCTGNTYKSSGRGELPGNDYMVTFGEWSLALPSAHVGTVQQQAGTLIHELGHNLQLRHAGATSSPNYKPNYLSVMNYRFQLVGIPASNRVDYSAVSLPTLNESVLDEGVGISDGSDNTTYSCGGATLVGSGSGPINWNCSGPDTENPVAADITGDGLMSTLAGFNDWGNILYAFQCTPGYADGAHPPSIVTTEELDFDTAFQRHVLFPVRTVQVQLQNMNINLGAGGRITATVLSTSNFDATTIDTTTLRLAGAPPVGTTTKDVDKDGRVDLQGDFVMKSLQLAPSSRVASLSAYTFSSQAIFATVPVRVVPPSR